MATSGGKSTREFALLLCYIFEFSKTNIYYLQFITSNNTAYRSRHWLFLSLA